LKNQRNIEEGIISECPSGQGASAACVWFYSGVIVKKNNILKIFILFTVFFSISAYGNDIDQDEFIIGKLEFTGKSGREGIVILNVPGKAYLLNKGVLLLIKRGNEKIVLKIDDFAGKYFRCRVNSEKDNAVIKEGEDVYYSDSFNGSIKYRDAKRILGELIKLYENFILKVESTEDTHIIAEAVTVFSVELDKLIPEMKRINSKYPELGKSNVSPPSELQSESEMLEILQPRLKNAFFKIQLYNSDVNVKKATDDLQKVLTKMNTGR